MSYFPMRRTGGGMFYQVYPKIFPITPHGLCGRGSPRVDHEFFRLLLDKNLVFMCSSP